MSVPFPSLFRAVTLIVCLCAFPSVAQTARSLLTRRPSDSAAVVLAATNDGSQDATAALQSAIDTVQSTTRRGIVFIPPGRYRISNTIQIWSGIRLVGFGAKRPVLFLAPHSFTGSPSRPLLHYAGERPDDPKADPPLGNASTFYSGLLNVDIELGTGNPGATGVSFHVAQHGVLSHVRIDATGAYAAINGAGGSMTDLELVGGEYGITTHQTAASWPFLLMDSTITGQTIASVRTTEASPVLIRDIFSNAPTVLMIDPEHPGQIYMRDSTFSHIAGIALSIPSSPEATALSIENLRCDHVPQLTAIEHNASTFHSIKRLSFGLTISPDGHTETAVGSAPQKPSASLLPSPGTDVPTLPPDTTWRSLRDFGAKGDDITDDTAALRRAIASGHPIYLPQGRYRITQPITLAPSTVLIGLNPITTQITLADHTPAFANRTAKPTAMLIAPPHSHPILSGIGLSTGGINPAASAVLWQANEHSLLDDVRFLGGHGTALPNGRYRPPYNADRTADSDPNRSWDTQPPSLLVVGGGGTFRNLWSPNSYAATGLSARDTSIPAQIYLLSAEHHVRNEVTLDHVQNWQFFGLQTEAEKTEGALGIPLAITNSANLLFANSIFYRVSRTTNPAPTAVLIDASPGITFLNVDNRSQSAFPFQSTITAPAVTVHTRSFNIWTNQQ